MARKVFFITAFITLLALNGCALDKPQPFPLPLQLQSLSGVVVERQGQLWFQPCYERLWWPLQDLTEQQELIDYYRRFTLFSREALYVELQGAVDNLQDSALLVKSLDTVGGTAQTCYFSLEGLEFRAASSEPVWVADIAANQILVKSANPPGSYNFRTINETDRISDTQTDADTDTDRPANSQSEGAIQVSRSTDAAATSNASDVVALYRETTPVKQPLQVKIMRKRCIDAQNGTLLPYTAEMRFYGRLYQGCARKGYPLNREINGFYWYQPEAKPQVMFKLSADQRVQLVTRNAEGKTVTERGRWQQLQSGKLIFSMRDARQQEYLMLFIREADGRLILQTGSEHLLSLGATFRLWRPSGLDGGQVLAVTKPASDVLDPPASTVVTLPEMPTEQSSLLGVSRQQSSPPLSVLPGSGVQAADIDEELLNEIMVNEDDPERDSASGPKAGQ
ncbi:hypothetical protein [Amphritea sp.]|uniref:hypothetical protein n=1 Tax=Amphritea sp. TaxID=1872502 RepID=UPI003D151B00